MVIRSWPLSESIPSVDSLHVGSSAIPDSASACYQGRDHAAESVHHADTWRADARDASAGLLGLRSDEREASRIIMAARLRLRLIRQQSDPATRFQRARQIEQARDSLLMTAVFG
jgi:hypothetical protein